jgi:hypothetical protein
MLDIVVVSNAKTSVAESSSLSTDQFVNTETKGKSIWSVPINRDITGTVVVEKAQRHLLDGKIPDSTRITQLLELYQEMVEAENVAELTPREQQNTGPKFVGTAACKTCHINEWESWKKTKHAHAYHTLEVAGHETDPECLTCHTVGFGVSSGFISVEKTPNHVDVGCENGEVQLLTISVKGMIPIRTVFLIIIGLKSVLRYGSIQIIFALVSMLAPLMFKYRTLMSSGVAPIGVAVVRVLS